MFEPQFLNSEQQISTLFCVKYCSHGPGTVEGRAVPVHTYLYAGHTWMCLYVMTFRGKMSGRMHATMLTTTVVGDGI